MYILAILYNDIILKLVSIIIYCNVNYRAKLCIFAFNIDLARMYTLFIIISTTNTNYNI